MFITVKTFSRTLMNSSKKCRRSYVRRQRVGGIEQLEHRFALAADSGLADFGLVDRPPLQQVDMVYINESQLGPAPIEIAESTLVGETTNSFVIQTVANGVIQKWIPATGMWLDVSTPPPTANPQHCSSFLRFD